MNLPESVMKDLVALHLAGEASAETSKLAEEYLGRHPELRGGAIGGAAVRLPPSGEMAALRRVKEWLFLRSLFLGMAIFFTMTPMIFVWRGGEVVFLMWRDAPLGLTLAAISIALASWVARYVMIRQLRGSGL
jgi:hypothetical protein